MVESKLRKTRQRCPQLLIPSLSETPSQRTEPLLRIIFLVSRLNSLYPLLSLGYPMKMHTTDCLSSFPFRLSDGTRAKALQTNTRRTVDRWFFVVPELEWCLSLSFLAWLRFWIYTAVATASTQNFKPSLDWWIIDFAMLRIVLFILSETPFCCGQ